MPAAFITHAECLKHEMGAHHPERPERLSAIEDQLIASGLDQHLQRYDAPLASDEQLAPNRYMVRVAGSRAIPQTDVQRYLLRSAAQVTLAAGYTHFAINDEGSIYYRTEGPFAIDPATGRIPEGSKPVGR